MRFFAVELEAAAASPWILCAGLLCRADTPEKGRNLAEREEGGQAADRPEANHIGYLTDFLAASTAW